MLFQALDLTVASGDTRAVARVAADLFKEICHLPGFVVVGDVAIEESIHITRNNALRGLDYRQSVTQELVKGLVIAVRVKSPLNLAPVA